MPLDENQIATIWAEKIKPAVFQAATPKEAPLLNSDPAQDRNIGGRSR